jgi:hypothetical protein
VKAVVGDSSTTQYALYSQKTHILRVVDFSAYQKTLSMPVRLDPFQFDLISVAPVDSAGQKDQPLEIACLGLVDKYNTLAAIRSKGFSVNESTQRLTYQVAIRCAGKLVLYLRKHTALPKVSVDDISADPRTVAVAGGHVITVDLGLYLDAREVETPFIVKLVF